MFNLLLLVTTLFPPASVVEAEPTMSETLECTTYEDKWRDKWFTHCKGADGVDRLDSYGALSTNVVYYRDVTGEWSWGEVINGDLVKRGSLD